VSVVDINPQINDSSDDFWQRFFPDLAIEKPATAYCHRDASGGDVKVILYLSDVALENGPFSFILGSHRHRPGKFANMVQELNDTSGFSATDPKARRLFAALPSFLRKKCAFGNDLQTESEAAKQILAAEWKITANKGHAVVFDYKGHHSGGMVLEKERIVLTCVIG
jgi:ectoine hydroxylase-related dioxygenase (phytanoyl-CoA dioxygenase family)